MNVLWVADYNEHRQHSLFGMLVRGWKCSLSSFGSGRSSTQSSSGWAVKTKQDGAASGRAGSGPGNLSVTQRRTLGIIPTIQMEEHTKIMPLENHLELSNLEQMLDRCISVELNLLCCFMFPFHPNTRVLSHSSFDHFKPVCVGFVVKCFF